MFGKIFGKQNRTKSNENDAATNNSIQRLQQAVSHLDEREVEMDNKMQACYDNARDKVRNGDTKGAIDDLREKENLKLALDALQAERLSAENHIFALQSANDNEQTLKELTKQSITLQKTVKDLDMNTIQNSGDNDLITKADQVVYMMNAVDNIISNPLVQRVCYLSHEYYMAIYTH